MLKILVPLLVVTSTLTLYAQTPTTLDLLKQAQAAIAQAIANLTPAPTPTTITVAAGGDVQGALNTVPCGGTVAFASGVTYTGNYTFPNKSCGSMAVTVTTGGLTIPSGRVNPTLAAPFAKFTSANASPTFSFQSGSHDWILRGLEVKAGAGIYPLGLITIGVGDTTQTTLAQVPLHVIIDQCYIHGDPVTGAKFGVSLNGGDLTVTNSYLSDIKGKGQDAQALVGTNGPGPFLIQNNYLEAAGENVLFGGADPRIPGLIPTGIVITHNLFSKPLSWKGQGWNIKNDLEFKNAQNAHVFGNILENSFVANQSGFLLMVTPRNQSGGCPWCTVQNVEVDHNVFRHAYSWVNILGLDDTKDSSGVVRPSVRVQGINIHDNLAYDIGTATYGTGTSFGVAVNNGPVNVSIIHNTLAGTTSEFLTLTLGVSGVLPVNLQYTCDVVPEGAYGIAGSTTVGAPSWTAGVDPTSTFDYNAILPGGLRKIVYPGAQTRLGAYTFDTTYTMTPALTCADGKPAGADIPAVVTATGVTF